MFERKTFSRHYDGAMEPNFILNRLRYFDYCESRLDRVIWEENNG